MNKINLLEPRRYQPVKIVHENSAKNSAGLLFVASIAARNWLGGLFREVGRRWPNVRFGRKADLSEIDPVRPLPPFADIQTETLPIRHNQGVQAFRQPPELLSARSPPDWNCRKAGSERGICMRGNGENTTGMKWLAHRRPPPQGTGLWPRAARALAPAVRDAPRGRGLPETQGG
jgi:hypothetical protein